jgi:hypothetical protein
VHDGAAADDSDGPATTLPTSTATNSTRRIT